MATVRMVPKGGNATYEMIIIFGEIGYHLFASDGWVSLSTEETAAAEVRARVEMAANSQRGS